jgi:uncharacterized protein (DUF58 family)
MLIDPELRTELERATAAPRGRGRTLKNRLSRDPGGLGWRTPRKSEAKGRSRLERLFSRLLAGERLVVHLLVDASISMTWSGIAPPVPSEKFRFARRLAAALGCAALVRHGEVRITGFAPGRGRRSPLLRGREAIDALLAYLEGLQAGGNTHFAASLRNALARGGNETVFVIVSDFRDSSWERGIPALMHGAARVALVHLEDAGIDAAAALGGESDDEPALARSRFDVDIRERLIELSQQFSLDYVPVVVGTPFEAALLRALGLKGTK